MKTLNFPDSCYCHTRSWSQDIIEWRGKWTDCHTHTLMARGSVMDKEYGCTGMSGDKGRAWRGKRKETLISLSLQRCQQFLHICSQNSFKQNDFSNGLLSVSEDWAENYLLRKWSGALETEKRPVSCSLPSLMTWSLIKVRFSLV